MKKITISIILSSIVYSAFGQSYSLNLQKYWWYRYMLVNDFMKVGLNFGESIPAETRDHNGYNNIFSDPHLNWGDATQKLGNYYVLLGSEYALLKNNSLSTLRTEYEIYCGLKALERLDYYSEEHCRNFALTENNTNMNPLPSDLNGYFMRDDVSESFWLDPVNRNHFNRDKVCVKMANVTSDLRQRTDAMNSPNTFQVDHPCVPRYPVEESIDQFSEIYKGLAFLVWMLPSSLQYNGTNLKDLAKDELLRIAVYINPSQQQWVLKNPISGNCIYGTHVPNCTSSSPFVPSCSLGSVYGNNAQVMAGGIGEGILKLPVTNWTSTQTASISHLTNNSNIGFWNRFIWQAMKYVVIWPCGSDGPMFPANVSVFSRNWTLITNTNVTENSIKGMSIHCDLLFPQLPYIYRILWGGSLFKPEMAPANKDSYEKRFDKAPQCGLYNYKGNYANWEWSSRDRVTEGTDRGTTSRNGDYPGIDYMSMFNLHIMNKSSYATFYNNPYYRENLSTIYPYSISGINFGNAANPTYLKYLEYLSTTSHVTPTGRVTYRCAKQIELLPGFKADAGSNFLAFIQDYSCCVGGPTDPGGVGEKYTVAGDPFVMDTVEDVVPFAPYPIPEDTTHELNITQEMLTADSLNLFQQIMNSGDSDLISIIQRISGKGYSVGYKMSQLNSEKVIISPNPNNGTFSIQLNTSDNYKIIITDIIGMPVFSTDFRGDHTGISLHNIPAGTYTVVIRSGSLNYITKITIFN